MDGRDEKPDLADAAIGKIQETDPDLLIIKIFVFLADFSLFYPDAGIFINIIVFAGITFFKDLINRFAAMAAKRLIVKNYRVFSAIFSAVIAT